MRTKKLSNNKQRKISELVQKAENAINQSQLLIVEGICQEILQINPENADAFHLLAIVALNMEQYQSSEDLLKKACLIAPKRVDIRNNLLFLYIKQGLQIKALHCINESLLIQPQQADIHAQKAVLLAQLDNYQEALSSFDTALRIKPHDPDTLANKATMLIQLGDHQGALELCQKAIQIFPNHSHSLNALALIHFQQGNFNLAEKYTRKTLKNSPKATKNHLMLAKMKKLNTQDIEDISQHSLNNDEQARLDFALTFYFEQQKQYNKAFKHMQKANTSIRKEIVYTSTDDKQLFQQLKSTFTSNFLKKKAHYGSNDTCPIFIIGMPRSGTSLTEQIIASHPKVHGIGETDMILNIFQSLCKDKNNEQSINTLQQVDDSKWLSYANLYIQFLTQNMNHENISHYTDKTPTNFFLVGLIHILFPNARIIHCQRNAMDNCLSIYKEYFTGHLHKYAYNLDEMGEFYLLYQDLMQHWNQVLPDGVIYNLQYETLVNNQHEETAKLLKHCGLDWHDDCLNFHQNKRSVATASATQVRKPMYKTSVEGWRRYEKQLAPLAKKLGYL